MTLSADIQVRFVILFIVIAVSPAGNAAAAVIDVPGDYPTIQAAVDAAQDGDLIMLADGVYSEAFDVQSKAVTIRSRRGPDHCSIARTRDLKINIMDIESGAFGLYGVSFIDNTCLSMNDALIETDNAWVCIGNCRFVDNALGAPLLSAHVLKFWGSTVKLTDCEITGTWVQDVQIMGGSLIRCDNTDIEIRDCNVHHNDTLATVYAVHSTLTVDGCVFHENAVEDDGGAIWAAGSETFITRSSFTGNYAQFRGGAIYLLEPRETIIGGAPGLGNVFAGNTAPVGNHLVCRAPETTRVNAQYNTFDCVPNGINIRPRRHFDLEYCTVADPGVSCDVYVSPNGQDTRDGLTPATAFRSVTHALGVVNPDPGRPVTIHLSPGVYAPATTGDMFPLMLFDDVFIAGNDAGTTILDARRSGTVISFELCRHTGLKNISVTGGDADLGGGIYCGRDAYPVMDTCIIDANTAVDGGGVYCEMGSGPVFMDCRIESNTACDGGGLYARESDLVMLDCRIDGNSASDLSGGVRLLDSVVEMARCRITNNRAEFAGGLGISVGDGVRIIDCRIASNVAQYDGGGVECYSGAPEFGNCLVCLNSAGRAGGAMIFRRCEPEMVQCTIAANTAPEAGGILCEDNGDATLRNSIVYGNAPDGIRTEESTATVTFSNVAGGWPGDGNLDMDPRFISGPDGDFYLDQYGAGAAVQSPCVDAGSGPAAKQTFRMFGNPCTMAAFTTRIDSIPDTGVVDMGYHYTTADFVLTPAVVLDMTTRATPGTSFHITGRLYNPGGVLTDVPAAFGVQLGGMMYFWPGWSTAWSYQRMDVFRGMTRVEVIPECDWPDTGSASDDGGRGYGAMLTDDGLAIRGAMDAVAWGYGP